jgi:hypothetical protein
MKQTQTKNNH